MYPPKTFAQVEQPFFLNIFLPEPPCVLRFNQFGGGSLPFLIACVLRFNQFGGGSLPFLIEILNRPGGTGWFASWVMSSLFTSLLKYLALKETS